MKKIFKFAAVIIGAIIMLVIGIAIGDSSKSGGATPAPTVTVTAPTVPADAAAPVPTITQTQTVAPPPPAAGTTIATLTGSGNQATKSFNVPPSGDYLVSWQYSGNNSSGDGGDNFSIQTTGSNGFSGDLPNDIATSGHGSTEITGDSGSESFNVQADSTCNWTIAVTSAS